MDPSLYQALLALSTALEKLAACMQALREDWQPPLIGHARTDLRIAVKAAQSVLVRIEAHRHAAHWKTRRKFASIAREVRVLADQLQGLDKELAARAQAPVSRSIGPPWLEIAGDRFTDVAAHFGKLAKYYGRKAFGARLPGKVIADHDAQGPVPSFERRRLVASEALYLKAPDVVVGEPAQMATLIPVYFATDRSVDDNTKPPRIAFKNGRGTGVLTYGVAEVSISPGHKLGRLERPTIWKFQFVENPEKHVVVSGCEVKDLAAWQAAAAGRIEQTGRKAALVFIHGYNTTFDEALRRTAQVAHDLQFDGLVTAYSWGSEGRKRGYFADGEAVELTAPLLRDFLAMLRQDLGVDTVHVIAHSMGNRALVGAISSMPLTPAGAPLLNEVVLAAPDIDVEIFKAAVAGLGGKAHRYTLYGSEKDRALAISKKLRRGYPRAGDGGANIVVVAGIETVDASAVGEDLLGLGHAYFASKRALLSDLFYLIRESLPASKRHGMREALLGEQPYWLFQP